MLGPRAILTGLLAFGVLTACAPEASDAPDPANDVETGDVAIQKLLESPPWVYEGPMPALVAPSLVVSITGHTLRVTGTLPQGFDAETLPWYALRSKTPEGQTKVSVIYPVATGKQQNGTWNNVPGHYGHLNVRPYRPKDADQLGKEHWGGFPFLNYHDARRFALHGPIDYTTDTDVSGDAVDDFDWRLVRGRVSKGCQRMQGEHVLELTHMLGFDMRWPHSPRENGPDPKNGVEGKYLSVSLDVLAEPALDSLPGAEIGAASVPSDAVAVPLDVAYPRHESAPSIPYEKKAFVAPTWDANEMRAWACAVQNKDNPNLDKRVPRTGGRFDGAYCKRTNGANARDPKTGAQL